MSKRKGPRPRRRLPPGRPQAAWQGPPFCANRRCGLAVEPAYAATRPARCEDCWAQDQRRFSGNDQSVDVSRDPELGASLV